MASASRVRSLYRSVLASPRSQLHTRLRDSFSSSSSSTDTLHRETATAEQLLMYLRSQRMYATLVDRYNPGMNMSDEERIRLTARRVGMDLPKTFSE
jgi:ATP synthase assembly factor FMC1, mitochondrial